MWHGLAPGMVVSKLIVRDFHRIEQSVKLLTDRWGVVGIWGHLRQMLGHGILRQVTVTFKVTVTSGFSLHPPYSPEKQQCCYYIVIANWRAISRRGNLQAGTKRSPVSGTFNGRADTLAGQVRSFFKLFGKCSAGARPALLDQAGAAALRGN